MTLQTEAPGPTGVIILKFTLIYITEGISVLPVHYGGAMVPTSPSSQSKDEDDVTKTPVTQPKMPVTQPKTPVTQHNERVKKVKKRPNNKPSSSSPARPQTRSNMNVARATEWQYADSMVITELEELRNLDKFIGQKVTSMSKYIQSFIQY